MNKRQYKTVCELCDKVLLDVRSTKVTIAISWLHISRWHPHFLKNHNSLFGEYIQLRVAVVHVLQSIRYVATSLFYIIKSVWKKKYWHCSHSLPKKLDVIFFSHLMNKNEVGLDRDSYYGNLTDSLLCEGITSIIVKIDHTKNGCDQTAMNWSGVNTPRLILSKVLPFCDELRILFLQYVECIRLIKYSFDYSGLYRRVLSETSIFALSPNTADTLRIARQVEVLLTKVQPKCVVLTYEGFAWERLVFSSIRELDSGIKCIGYQHAAIFKSQHSLLRRMPSIYNPDIVLTSGKVTERQLKSVFDNSKTIVECLGSRQASLSSMRVNHNKYKKTCLVVPEPFKSETEILFDFSISCAEKYPDIVFIWRLHPITNFDNLIKNSPHFSKLTDNIIFSEETLEFDTLRSSFVMYRGSTAVIKAISNGVIPLYIQQRNELSIDPIHNYKKTKSVIINEIELKHAMDDEYNEVSLRELSLYGRKYYTPFVTNVLVNILNKS
jgi:hypothetical protein